ncbi:MAG: FAD:protein FMN transferase [Pirellulaceae bacterium]
MQPGLLTTLTHRAMATEFVVMLPATDAAAADLALGTLEMLDEIEAKLTIYQPESEISQVNRDASDRPVIVSAETFSILKRAVHWSQQTSGAFDITAGPLVQAWGFTKRTGRKPSASEIQAARKCVGYQYLILNESDNSVAFAVPGMSINLGGIGKGYALDQLANQLTSQGVKNFLLHGGQSSVIARGDQSPGVEQLGWAVGISHPTKPQQRLAGIWLRDAALGTSGSGKQFFHHQGRRYGHVIDPRTGNPSGDLLSLTVLTASAADADASATGYFVAGRQVATQLFDSESAASKELSMVLVKPGRRQDSAELESFGEFAWVDEAN